MSSDDISVILHRLDEMRDRLDEIHSEVKHTNGRVTELEKKDAWWEGNTHAKKPIGMIVTTVFAYTVIGLITWYLLRHA
jgi:hypothetical protein